MNAFTPRKHCWLCGVVAVLFVFSSVSSSGRLLAVQSGPDVNLQTESTTQTKLIRFATFNISFSRKRQGMLRERLETGNGKNFERTALILQTVRPDVVLLNEFDFDKLGAGVKAFQDNFLGRKIGDSAPIEYPYVFVLPCNTGVDSKIDFNGDRKFGTANDAFGYGEFPGQYAMVVLSKYRIETDAVRTFQKFLWKDMPNARLPIDPSNKQPYYDEKVMDVFRLSSKSHWDIPILIDGATIHFLVSHPTPPAFDGVEDSNGCRNHDEIRLWADYVGNEADYLVDDAGKLGGLADGAHFVIAGDLNADPIDGDSVQGAIDQLLLHPKINATAAPRSAGGAAFAKLQGGKNAVHQGNPAQDTADFGDRSTGNLRVDYVLPSKSLELKTQSVFWPAPGAPQADWVKATDHRLVYADVVAPVNLKAGDSK